MSIYIYVCLVYLVIKSYKLLISCCISKVMFVWDARWEKRQNFVKLLLDSFNKTN